MNQPQSAVGNCLDVQSFISFIAPALSQDWGIDRASLGPVMSAALIGMVFGALGSGPMADRFGRKVVLVGAVLVFGAFSLASAYSTNVDQLLILRFLTGLGLGAGMPNATTLLTQGRATGVSWMLGIGRFGAILGAWMGATLLGLGWNFEQVLTALVIPAALATTAVVIKGMVSHADAT